MSNDPRQLSYWTDEERAQWDALAPLIMQIYLAGADSGVSALPSELQILVNWDYFNNDVAKFLNTYRLHTLAGITNTTRTQTVTAIEKWLESGEHLDTLIERLTPIYGARRAEQIAVTEVTRIYAEGNMSAWRSTGLVSGKRWNTAEDERVCFPAWTMVRTDKGDKPIQNLKPGDMVLTRKGYRPIRATSMREYSGKMRTITTEVGKLTATANHPIWSKHGWLQIGKLLIGDTIETFDNQTRNVDGVFDFAIRNSDNMPSPFMQELVFACIPPYVSMPIRSVDFKGYSMSSEKKINRISSYARFLDVFNFENVKDLSDAFLQEVLALMFAVTRKRAELSVSISGLNADFSSACAAIFDNRRAAANLGTKTRYPSGLATFEQFSATFASILSHIDRSTFPTTNGISISNRGRYSKLFSTLRANLGNHFWRVISFITRACTPFFTVFDLSRRDIKLPIAMQAVNKLSRSFSLLWGKLCGVITRWHNIQLLNNINVLYHKSLHKDIKVYDIQVEDVHEFYANGILVHNCPICGPLDGMIVGLDENGFTTESGGLGVTAPPIHVNCRCWLTPVVGEDLLRDQLRRILA